MWTVCFEMWHMRTSIELPCEVMGVLLRTPLAGRKALYTQVAAGRKHQRDVFSGPRPGRFPSRHSHRLVLVCMSSVLILASKRSVSVQGLA